MPILVPKGLPAYDILQKENVFVMHKDRAARQDIRPLKIGIVNLMPTKEVTETQLIRMLANTPLQVDLQLLTMGSHESKNADPLHMETFYLQFDDIKNQRFDGLIITGAPVEFLPFEQVDYWTELTEIMEYAKTNVFSTLHLCWGAQAGLYYHYGINKQILDKKLFGVFKHRVRDKRSVFTRGFDEEFFVPHSRHTQVAREEVEREEQLCILVDSREAGLHMVMSNDKRMLFLQGHSEYDWDTLKLEYERDRKKDAGIDVPVNYFKDDNPEKRIVVKWSGHGNLFFANWLNFIYQETPFDLKDLPKFWEAAGI
jgi:homoserine O-succinyltransferase